MSHGHDHDHEHLHTHDHPHPWDDLWFYTNPIWVLPA
jgi:hypothetical protein